MKNKPLKHKTKNAFQFKSFHERIAEVDVRRSALYYVEHENEALEENQSYFHQTIQKWSVLNLTEEYQRFQAPLRAIITLPQLLHKKDFVLEHLLRSFESATCLSLQALLEFVVVLAKDLREDFCPYFERIFDRLIFLLKTNDPNQLEWTLLCLAFLFKILRGFLRKRLDVVFERIVTLLDDGNPLHLTNFAAECFSFVARDTKNKRELVYMITAAVRKNPTVATGCGRLLFEIMRGVNQQFHSCAEEYWKLLLLEIINEAPNNETGFDPEVLFHVLIQTVSDMLQCIESAHLKPFWSPVYRAAENCLGTGATIQNEQSLHYMLQLIGAAVEHYHGKYLDNASQMIGLLVKVVNVAESERILSSVTKIATIMMLSRNLNITQLDASRLSKNIMAIGSRSRTVFEDFVLGVVDYAMFEILILPDYMKFFEKNFDSDSLKLLAGIATKKSPPCRNGINLDSWKQFPIKLKHQSSKDGFLALLTKGGQRANNRKDFLNCVVLVPHLVDFERDEQIDRILENEIVTVLGKLNDSSKGGDLVGLSLLVEALVHLKHDKMSIFNKIVTTLLPIVANTKQEHLIDVISLCLVKMHQDKPKLLNESLFDLIHLKLSDFLGSVHHRTRLLVTYCFTLFNDLPKLKIKNEDQSLFDVLYALESVEPTIHTYREQVMLLKKLEFDTNLFQGLQNEQFRLDAMRYVLSLLSVNFKLLWEPTREVLQTYAEEFAVSDFWNIYKHQLNFVLDVVKRHPSVQEQNNDEDDLLGDMQDELSIRNEKIDYVNFRVQLLVALSKLNRIFEAKNRDIVEAFLGFIQTEYRLKQTASTQDGADEGTPKATQKILIAYLNIFALVKNPKTIFKSGQLYELFEELLTHRSFEVQKLALDCIFTYSNAAFMPYKENIYRLSSEKTLKEEMQTFFTEDPQRESKLRCIVLDEHRPQVVPLVLKIVHTRMVQKVTPPELKALLLRFVGHFQEAEINIFISMSFSYFEKLLKSNPLETYQAITASEKRYEDDLPVYRIQVLMKLIDSIRDQFAGLKDETFIQYLLHIKFCMDSILSKMDHSVVKQQKSQALTNMAEFFDHFDNYKWTEEEIETVFNIYVRPQIDKLEVECIHSPTPLLKLITSWSKNPRYYPLLVKSLSGPKFVSDSTPLARVISLLNSEKVGDAVCQEILKMIIAMLTLITAEDKPYAIPVANSQRIDDNIIAEYNFNLGSYLLFPFVMDILSYIQRVMKRRRSINKDHLLVLSRIAEYVKAQESCDAITDMLFPMTVRKITLPHVEADTIRQMHTALYSLMKMVTNPAKHLRLVGLMLERVRDVATRQVIIQMIKLIAEKSKLPEHEQCASVIEEMNAMDRRWLDQPDYDRRLAAFRTVDRIMESGTSVGTDLTVLFVHQCFYYLKTDKDLAVRDNANHYLRKIIISSIKLHGDDKPGEVRYLIERVILTALMKGIKDKSDATRNESIQLLGDLSRECADYCTVFADLYPFTSSQDREIDFFDNITHLQIHRHRRAMNRFCKVAQKLSKAPSTRTLVNFLLPIVSSYLCCEKYRKKSKLTEATGNCVAMIARMLPWSNYKILLKQYLGKMKQSIEYQKQLIRIVVALLDNFHFDLSQADTSKLQDADEIVQLKSSKDEASVTDIDAEIDPEAGDKTDQQDDESDHDDDEDKAKTNDEPSKATTLISFATQTVLTKESAEAVMYDISKILIPDLFSAINYKETQDSIKINERKERYKREKEDMLKIPIAIAIVKLLQKLPKRFMDLNLPKLLIKVISFLKSNLKQVRNIARDTLKNMLLSVGPSFLRIILENLSAILSRGFQVHVMVVTVHTLLDAVKDKLDAGIVDDILQLVLSMCINDIFGKLAEEKEVGSVASKTPEAKPSKKSFLMLQILAKQMSETSTLDLILPFKEIIAKTNSRKTIMKVEEALSKIGDGICSNPNINVESTLIFVFGITSESIPDLVSGSKKATLSEKQKEKIKQKRPDIYLIPAEPKRRGAFNQIPLVTSSKTNAHVFVEMGLEILHTLIKKSQVLTLDYEAFLEPLVPILVDSMNSNHVKVTTLGIKCITSIWASKLNLSNVEQNVATIVENLLKLLHKYATAVLGRNDDNFQLVKSTFKAVVTLLKFVKYFTISNDQLKVLLLYVEQDLYHNEKQNMALILLRSIIGRKLIADEMAAIIKKVAELSITHDNPRVRDECRQVVLEYLMNYSLGKNIDHTIHFYISQLEYETIAGRESAVQMLHLMFKSFPTAMLNQKAAFFFLTVGIRLVNEESSECRALVAESLETLLTRVNKTSIDELLTVIVTMLSGSKVSHRELAAQLVMRIVNVEKELFYRRLEKVLPTLLSSITCMDSEGVGKFVKLKAIEATDEDRTEMKKAKDHSLIQTLNAFTTIFETCPDVLTDSKFNELIDELAYNLQPLLTHGHQWVRFASLKLHGIILSSIDFEAVHKILTDEQCDVTKQYIYSNPSGEAKSLVLDMCTQLIPAETEEETASLVAQNLLLIANMLKAVPLDNSESTTDENKTVNLIWLIRRVRYAIQSEVAKAPKSFLLRKQFFQWMEALTELLDEDTVVALAPSMLSPMMREISDEDHIDETVKQIVVQLGNQIKAKIGDEKYDEIRLNMQTKIREKRTIRQRTIAMEKINNPMQAAKRKSDVKNRKKEAKKRKIEELKNTGKKIHKGSLSAKGKRKRMEDLFQS